MCCVLLLVVLVVAYCLLGNESKEYFCKPLLLFTIYIYNKLCQPKQQWRWTGDAIAVIFNIKPVRTRCKHNIHECCSCCVRIVVPFCDPFVRLTFLDAAPFCMVLGINVIFSCLSISILRSQSRQIDDLSLHRLSSSFGLSLSDRNFLYECDYHQWWKTEKLYQNVRSWQ